MASCLECNICDAGSGFDDSLDMARVPSNIRRFSAEHFTVWRCRSCGSLHCKEDVDLARYYAGYPAWTGGADFWDRLGYRNLVSRWRGAGLRRRHDILDYGCAGGNLVRYLRRRGYGSVQGWDPHSGSYRDAGVLDRRFDFITAQDVIEHDEEPRDRVRDLAWMLNPGGVLSLGTPNADGIDLSTCRRQLQPLHQPFHRHIPSARGLAILGQHAGLRHLRTYDRYYYDTPLPTVNHRFLEEYVIRAGNVVDVAFEPARPWVVLRSPALWAAALFGYLYPPRTAQTMLFCK